MLSISKQWHSPRDSTPIAIVWLWPAPCSSPSRRRISTRVTMRPRRLSTPAISAGASGTFVRRSGAKTSCTRRICRPNSWPPISAVTYSCRVWWVSLMAHTSCGPTEVGLFLECRDQPLPIELGDEIMESHAAAALDRFGRHHRGQRDDRQFGSARVGPHDLGELEATHIRHFDIGDGHIE